MKTIRHTTPLLAATLALATAGPAFADKKEQDKPAFEATPAVFQDAKPKSGKTAAKKDRGPIGEAKLLPSGEAVAPKDAPPEVKKAIAAANEINETPYVYGGGHASFESSGYDCSGAVSYALHGGGFLDSPLSSSSDLMGSWGESGEGEWITTYGNSGHAYVVIAGLRFDTAGTGSSGPRWHESLASDAGGTYVASHPKGF